MAEGESRKWSFEDFAVFKRAYAVSLEVHRASLSFPQAEQFALATQIRRASRSICALIAEGSGRQRGSSSEFKRYLTMAMGSADEMQVWTMYCRDLKYVDEETAARWRTEYLEIAKMLQGFVSNIGNSDR